MKKSFKKYFVPNEENDHKPHFLREKSVTAIAGVALLLLLASIIGSYVVKNSKFLASIQSAFLVDLANQDRASEGAGALVMNEKLAMAAQLKANDMAEKSYFAHTSPEGITPWHWFGEAQYSYIYAGENLAVNFSRSEDVQRAWMNSPTHRANILNNRYREIGIATAQGMYKGKSTTFVVQMFGTPSSANLSTASNQEASVATAPVSAPVTSQPSVDLLASSGLTPQALGESVESPSDVSVAQPQEVKSETLTENKPASNSQVTTAKEEPKPVVDTQTLVALNTEPEMEVENSFTETVNPLYENQNVAGAENNTSPEVYTSRFERFLVNPGEAVNKAYVILFVLILFSLILKIFIAINKQHPKNIAYGVLLLILVLIFMYINQEMFVTPVIASV